MLIHALFVLLLILLGGPLQASVHAEENGEKVARRLINALGCKGCHRLAGDGGSLAPALDDIGSRMTSEQIREQLAAHTAEHNNQFMPNYRTTSPAELKSLSDFLYNFR